MKLYASPWKYGLLGGLSDFFKGIGDAQNQQRKFQNDMSLANVKAQNDRMVKLMEAEARQRSYKVNETDPDTGKPMVASYRNTVNKDGTTTPVLLGRIPADDKMAIQDREDQRAAANRSSIENVNSNIQNHIDARAAADRAAKANGGAASVTQQGPNTRAVMKATQADMQELHAAHGSERDALLKAQGIDPKASDAEAQYRAKMFLDNSVAHDHWMATVRDTNRTVREMWLTGAGSLSETSYVTECAWFEVSRGAHGILASLCAIRRLP
jgi:hypothetical protein